ncbi:MAG TPA: zinc-ribbon domain-containing protein [Candidatus Limnocylindrales bacterium]
MPTFKHPCPHCGKYIERDVAACPFCGTADPFAPGRCPNCSTVIEDLTWVSCPKCGQALPKPASSARPQPASAAPAAAQPQAPSGKCSGCGAPLAAGARFCTVCGTLAG